MWKAGHVTIWQICEKRDWGRQCDKIFDSLFVMDGKLSSLSEITRYGKAWSPMLVYKPLDGDDGVLFSDYVGGGWERECIL